MIKTWLRIPTNTDIDLRLSQWWGRWAAKELQSVDIDVHVCNRGPDRARNEIIEAFLSSDAYNLWLLDRDVVPPSSRTVIYGFLSSIYPVVSGVTDIYNGRWHYQQVYKQDDKSQTYWTQSQDKWPLGARCFRADAAGAGCLCVLRETLASMKPPWFEFEGPSGPSQVGEDISFCRKVGGVVIDSKMMCRHYKVVDLSSIKDPRQPTGGWVEASTEYASPPQH